MTVNYYGDNTFMALKAKLIRTAYTHTLTNSATLLLCKVPYNPNCTETRNVG